MDDEIFANNHNMLALVGNLGFSIHTNADDSDIKMARKLLLKITT